MAEPLGDRKRSFFVPADAPILPAERRKLQGYARFFTVYQRFEMHAFSHHPATALPNRVSLWLMSVLLSRPSAYTRINL